MATILKTKNSVTTTVVPTTLAQGELAVNITDKKMWVGNAASSPVQIVGAGVAGNAGGSTTQVQYNSSGVLAGSANMTFSGTALTLANDASISGLTVGKGGSAVSGNVIVNTSALASNTTGSNLVAVGDRALNANTTGNGNSAFGYLSLYANTTGGNNTGLGGTALIGNTTGSYNTAVGYDSLRSNTTASNNTAVGYQAGYSNTTATGLTAIGFFALQQSTGAQNTALGSYAGYAITTGQYNTAIGRTSMYANTVTGSYNSALGISSLYNLTTGSNNTALGSTAGNYLTTGTDNTYVGFGAGNYTIAHTTGSACLYVGTYANPSSTSVNNEMVICNYGVTGKGASTAYIYANAGGVYQGNNSATWSITSDARLKKNIVDNNTGLSAITAIQVRNFEYRLPEEITGLPKEQAIENTGIQLGAIAQELQAILPECVKTESTGVMSVDTTNLTWYLINAVKELNAKITALENR